MMRLRYASEYDYDIHLYIRVDCGDGHYH